MALDSSNSEQQQPQVSTTDPSLSRNSSFNNSRLNGHSPEFVPTRTTTTAAPESTQQKHQFVIPPSPFHAATHHYMHLHQQQNQRRHYQNHQRGVKREEDQRQQQQYQSDDVEKLVNNKDHDRNNNSSEDSTRKILNQVEYYFSDLNLATTDHLLRYINKDPEGYVPISVVASFRQIKTLMSNISHLATILRNSSKLVVSEDGKKVRRQQPLTESDMDELQSRIIVAENLPEDHCHQNLMKIFSAAGSVKTIRTCQPQTSGGGSSALRSEKSDNMHFSNKLHAFVEYESVELAEKAVAELNEEANWRSGLRLRLMFRRTAKSAQPGGRKPHDGEGQYEEDAAGTFEQVPNEKQLEDTSHQSDFINSHEHVGEKHVQEKEGGQRRAEAKGGGKIRTIMCEQKREEERGGHIKGQSKGPARAHHNHYNNNRGNHVGTPSNNNVVSNEQSLITKHPPGPRMPDGTRGFSMGRGKPITT